MITTDDSVQTYRRHQYASVTDGEHERLWPGAEVGCCFDPPRGGFAVRLLGWEIEIRRNDEEVRTGQLLFVPVGDDSVWKHEPNQVKPISDGDYCPGCGQLGCPCAG